MPELGRIGSKILAVAAAISLVACATKQPEAVATPTTTAAPAIAATPVQAKPYPQGIQCVWHPLLRNGYYTVLDNSHVVIETTGKKYYLLTLARYCMDLDASWQIAFQSHGDQLCAPGDSVITRSDRCMIQYLEPVAGTAQAKALVAARAAAKKPKKEGAPAGGK